MKKLLLIFLLSAVSFQLSAFSLRAQENRLADLSKQLIEAKPEQGVMAVFEEVKDIYFRDKKYTEFIDFLKSLAQKNKGLQAYTDYFIALSRFNQLKYLEENQVWDEYFDKGNEYRAELVSSAQKTVDSTTAKDPLNIYGRLILWQFHKAQEDTFADGALSDLMNATPTFSTSSQDIKPVKLVADALFSLGEKAKSKEIYKIYVVRLLKINIKDEELKNIALGFYNEGNLELAELIYDSYADRLVKSLPKARAIPLLIDMAKLFTYKEESAFDALYAEKVFAKIEKLGGEKAFDEELLYSRAYNLEKAKQYPEANDIYAKLLKLYPETLHADEADYKTGIISAYVLRDIESARKYFKKLADKKTKIAQVISSIYQLGLLNQWQGDSEAAKGHYKELIELAGENFKETADLAYKRLIEIEEKKPMEYALKTFLDISLKPEFKQFDMAKLQVASKPYKAKMQESVSVNANSYLAPSGCMQVELHYLWSGHLGKIEPQVNDPSFNTKYIHPGTKEINLVVVSPSGIIDRSLDLIDIY
jgi:tetratricopeptide (TPR) repeat protein